MDESNIPIDINIGKLQDWLVSRRHVNKDWQKNIIAVREKINNAIQDMPAHEDIAALLSGSYINYFHCLKIIEILKETEADTKNLFGRYGSQRMKDWLDIVRSYEKDNLYLAEAAQIFCRNITYEIPSIKKQIAKEEQMQTECEKKEADYLKSQASSKAEFLSLCKQLGIKGDQIKRELVERLQELPDIYDKIGKSLKPLRPAIELYSAFTKYNLGEQAADLLPLLQYVVEHGNTTVYQWSRGEPPLSVQPDPVLIQLEDDQPAADQIDYGEDAGIDFGADIELGEGDAPAEIDWGDSGAATIELVPADMSSVSGGVARGRDALSVLDCPHTRSQFLDQLLELESFLAMRVYETSAAQEARAYSLWEQLPAESEAALRGMLAAVHGAAAALLAPDIAHLHNVKHSPRYVDVVSAQLQQKLALRDKQARLAERAAARGADAARRAAALRPQHERLRERTADLQHHIEKEISKKYKGRPVNIIGGVKFL